MGLARSKSAKSPALAAIISGTHELTSLDSEGRRSQALVQIEAGEILEITTLRIVVCYSLFASSRGASAAPTHCWGNLGRWGDCACRNHRKKRKRAQGVGWSHTSFVKDGLCTRETQEFVGRTVTIVEDV